MQIYCQLKDHKAILENQVVAQAKGYPLVEVEPAYDGSLWEKGYAPAKPEPTEYEKAQERIAVLKAEIAKVDYKQFKYLRGELTAEEWEEVKAYIQARTAEINELELVVDNANTAL